MEIVFVLVRNLEGKFHALQAQEQMVQLNDLEYFIQRGLDERTIEWGGGSDFLFHPLGADLSFMVCNDADLHLVSTDSSLLLELGHKISSRGIKVYDSGRLI